MSRNRRLSNPPGGASTHNPFSWDEGTPESRAGGASVAAHTSTSPILGNGYPETKPVVQSQQPVGGASQIVFGESPDRVPVDTRSRPQSANKAKELSGSGIFESGRTSISSNAYANGNDQNNGNYITDRPSIRMHQPSGGRSSISFGSEEETTPSKELPSHRVAKQAELGGTLNGDGDQFGRQQSMAKAKELSGNDIFGPPPPFKESKPPSPNPILGNSEGTSVGRSSQNFNASQVVFGDEAPVELLSRRMSGSKMSELSGNHIFSPVPSASDADYKPSQAKVKELSGNDIFANEGAGGEARRVSLGGVRKPPGGDSTLALV